MAKTTMTMKETTNSIVVPGTLPVAIFFLFRVVKNYVLQVDIFFNAVVVTSTYSVGFLFGGVLNDSLFFNSIYHFQ